MRHCFRAQPSNHASQQRSKAHNAAGRCSFRVFYILLFIVWALFLGYYVSTGHNLHFAVEELAKSELFLRGAASAPPAQTAKEAIAAVPAAVPAAAPAAPDVDDVHVIFSTDCTPYQDWQSILLFHSATVVKQKGAITRIASGCDEQRKKELVSLYATLYPQYHVHFTPDFKRDNKTNAKYAFYNKPFGLKDWLDHAQPRLHDDQVIALIDPDMIFLRPLTPRIRGEANNLHDKKLKPDELQVRVERGKPAAQLYGLGAPWCRDDHKKFNRTHVCGLGSPCLQVKERYGEQHYSVGPPYIAVRSDFVLIAEAWTKFVPRVYEKYPFLLAEMYAYSMAAAHVSLPHLQMEHYMVSNTDAGGEGWPLVDKLPDACEPPDDKGLYYPRLPMPTLLHFCQHFGAGGMGFYKGAHRDAYITCDAPPLPDVPADVGKIDFYKFDFNTQKDQFREGRKNKRGAFALCILHKSINAALGHFKQKTCT